MEAGAELPEFVEDVAAYLKDKDADAVIKTLQDAYARLQMQESRLLQQRLRLQNKLPEIKKALDMVSLLLDKQGTGEEVRVDYQLVDNVFSQAVLQDTETVSLWLGANVMLEYSVEEAKALLTQNYANARSSLEAVKRDVLSLRDSITTTEVSIARIFNEDVKRRRALGGK